MSIVISAVVVVHRTAIRLRREAPGAAGRPPRELNHDATGAHGCSEGKAAVASFHPLPEIGRSPTGLSSSSNGHLIAVTTSCEEGALPLIPTRLSSVTPSRRSPECPFAG